VERSPAPITRDASLARTLHSSIHAAVLEHSVVASHGSGGAHAGRWSRTGENMANVKEALTKIMQMDGAIGACIVDSNSGMMLGAEGGAGTINLEVAAAGNTEVVGRVRKLV
jgi:hypothetical protein